VWVPWQRPGFELALMLRKAVEAQPGCDGIILGGHGLFTWGSTQRECYLNSIKTIDQMGEFVQEHEQRAGREPFGGAAAVESRNRNDILAGILPFLRGAVSSNRRVIAHYDNSADAMAFVNSNWAEKLCELGTSCPDHFLRTRISPLFVGWKPAGEGLAELKQRIADALVAYREKYIAYYKAHADSASPALRDSNPSVVIIRGLGLFAFGKDKREARITSEFFINAIHVMAGANALEESSAPAGGAAPARTNRQRTSRASTITWRSPGRKRSASSTGRSKRPSCSGCRRSVNSAGRSSSLSAARAVSGAKRRFKSPGAAATW
jgi:rhamnose utilization protein RhaD (predicted bifunctional aldolase and dehydrogenase)